MRSRIVRMIWRFIVQIVIPLGGIAAAIWGYYHPRPEPRAPLPTYSTSEDKKAQKTLEALVADNMSDFKSMPEPRIELAEVLSNPRENRSMYINGQKVIQIKKSFYYEADTHKLHDVIRHEMIHAWVDFKGYPSKPGSMHGIHWLRKAKEIGFDIDPFVGNVSSKYPER